MLEGDITSWYIGVLNHVVMWIPNAHDESIRRFGRNHMCEFNRAYYIHVGWMVVHINVLQCEIVTWMKGNRCIVVNRNCLVTGMFDYVLMENWLLWTRIVRVCSILGITLAFLYWNMTFLILDEILYDK